MLTDQDFDLLRILFNSPKPVVGKALAAQLGISERTLRNRVHGINERIGSAIVQAGRNGYSCNRIETPKLLSQQNTRDFSPAIPQTKSERRAYALKRIVQLPGEVNIYDLAEELFVSASTIRNDLRAMAKSCSKYDLGFVHKGDTLSIEGTEKNKRRLLSALLYEETSVNFMSLDTIQKAFPDIDVVFIRSCVTETLDQARYFVNDYSLINLVLHIAIAIDRVGHIVQQNEYSAEPSTEDRQEASVIRPHESEMAHRIALKISEHFGLPFSASEEYELALLLASRTTMLDYREENRDDFERYIDPSCLELVNEIIEDVSTYYFIDLSEKEFYVRFALHINNLLARARANSFVRNPLTDEIKSSCPLLYDTAVTEAGLIKRRTGITINDDEIAYIAFHLGSTIEAQKQLSSKVRCVLYCPAYYNIDRGLRAFMSKHFANEAFVAYVATTPEEISLIPDPELILTTNPLSGSYDVPVLRIAIKPRNTDVATIRSAIEEIQRQKRRQTFKKHLCELVRPELFVANAPFETREDVIHAMSTQLLKLGYVNEGFEHDVFEREQLSSTAFGVVAVPHTMKPYANRSSISILIPEKQVHWGDAGVQLVLLLSFARNQRATFNELFDPLVSILVDPLNVQELAKTEDYRSFIECLVEMLP